MVDTTQLVSPLMCDLVWQSSAILLVALVVVRYVMRQPARAHAVLLLALLAAIIAPVTSEFVRRQGWGIIEAGPISTAPELALVARPNALSRPAERASMNSNVPESAEEQSPFEPGVAQSTHEAAPGAGKMASPALSIDPSSRSSQGTTAFAKSPRSWAANVAAPLGGLWLLASLVLAVRLLRGAWAGLRLISSAEPCQSTNVLDALAIARLRLDLVDVPVAVFQSPLVRCPMIWCWGRGPKLLLPVEAIRTWAHERWLPILCHELAHWKRRDHLSALVAELVCCLLPWQPLAWIAKRRLEQASEEACDDWTVAAGHSPVDYAETLLGLAAQADPPLALAALRRRSGLASRVRHILSQAVPRPRLGRLWTAAALTLATIGVGVTAICQRGVARADDPKPGATAEAKEQAEAKATKEEVKTAKPTEAPKQPNKNAAMAGPGVTGTFREGGAASQSANKVTDKQKPSDELKRYTAHGRIVGPQGQPIPGASLTWEARRKNVKDPWAEPPIQLSQMTTDADGRFSLDAEFIESDIVQIALLIRADGFGVRSYFTVPKKLSEPIEIALESPYSIEGTVFTPNSEPVKNAKVIVTAINRYARDKADRDMDAQKSWFAGLSPVELKSLNPRAWWPAPVETDENGQFRFADLVPQSATAQLIIVAKDFANTQVAVAHAESVRDTREQVTNWREPKLTLVLEEPWLIEGRFVDEQSGEGIADVALGVAPNNYRRGMQPQDWINVKSDAEGRYVVRAGSADIFHIDAKPPKGYPGISRSLNASSLAELPGRGRKKNYEVKLRRGIILHGRVLAADTSEPVANADVMYRPERGRKLGANSNFEPVKTAEDGSFEVTGVDGKGFLLVDAPDRGFYRLVVEDKRAQRYSASNTTHPHGFLEIDVPADGSHEPFEVRLNRGRELAVRAIGPSGEAINELNVGYAEQSLDRYFNATTVNDGMYRTNEAQPGRTYRMFLFSPETMSGTIAEIAAPEDGHTVEVRLQACGTIRGRYVYAGGAPAADVHNFPRFDMEPGDHGKPGPDFRIFDLQYYYNFARLKDQGEVGKGNTNGEGQFELRGIVPGVLMYLGLNYKFDDGNNYRAVGTLQPGEIKDVGDLVIRSR